MYFNKTDILRFTDRLDSAHRFVDESLFLQTLEYRYYRGFVVVFSPYCVHLIMFGLCAVTFSDYCGWK